MAGKKGYYRPVPGSKELRTRKEDQDDIFLKIESEVEKSAPPGPLFEYGEETLGGILIQTQAAAMPLEIFDQVLRKMEPIEQAVYVQLFRLSFLTAKNFCRVGKKELAERTGMSLVRLNASLEGLVKKGFARPVHRSVRGTLWRVFHPAEVGVRAEYKVEEGKRVKLEVKKARPAKPAPPPKKAVESPLNVERFAEISGEIPELPLKKIAEKFFEVRNRKPEPDELDDALSVITGLLEDGFSRKQVLFALQWFAEKFPKEKDLSRLPYYTARALEEYQGG
jgi:hypothetical protein